MSIIQKFAPQDIRVILTKHVLGAGNIGDTIYIKKGFFKYLLRNKSALKYSEANMQYFKQEEQRLLMEDSKAREIASKHSALLSNEGFVLIRTISESGKLYGKITISEVQKAINHPYVKRNMLSVPEIYTPGIFEVMIRWHPTIISKVMIAVSATEKDAYNMLKQGTETNDNKTANNPNQ